MKTLALAVASALFAGNALAAPATPAISWEDQKYSFVDVKIDGSGSYKELVQRKDAVDIVINWNAWSGELGDTINVKFDGELVHQATLTAGARADTITFPYTKSGRHQMTLEMCQGDVCSASAQKPIVIADTDGGHLDPLPMNVDPNNADYGTQSGSVVGTYFVEWGIYGRKFDVSNIPAQNLTHILYGFIPVCGPNESLKAAGGTGFQALETACKGSQDYEVVIHDPWAAVQKALPGVDAKDPIRGTYSQLMALKQRYPELKILPSVGGWTLSDPFFDFTDKANRDVFVASMKEFLKTWKFYDGVDIDWEFPGGGGANPNLGDTEKDGPAYIALMQELRVMLDDLEAEMGKEYELSTAIGMGWDKIEDVDYQQAAQYLDYIFAMTYDYYGAWSNVTGHQTAIYCGEHMSAAQCSGTGLDEKGEPRKGPAYTSDIGIQMLLEQGVEPGKIVLGAAKYGRGWKGVYPQNATDPNNPMTATADGKLTGTTAQGVWEAGVIDYKGIKEYMIGDAGTGINGFEIGYDEQAEAAYVWNRTSGELITYDSPRSVIAKGEYARNLGLAGLFSWVIDADNGDILNAMHEGLATEAGNGKPVVTVAPVVTVKSGETTTIKATATDRDNDALTYNWTADSALKVTGVNSAMLTVTAPEVEATTEFVATITVSDGIETVTKDVTVRVVSEQVVVNQPPVVAPIEAMTITEGQSAALSVSATDANNDTLNYTWTVPAGLTVSGSGANVTLTASDVDADTNFEVSVVVSDGVASVTERFSVTVENVVEEGDTGSGNTTWNADTVYLGGDKVFYNGVEYKAKWWTRGNRPDQGGPWEEIIPNDGKVREWRPLLVYLGGDKVTYNGVTYTAKWWTKGDKPGTHMVWKAD